MRNKLEVRAAIVVQVVQFPQVDPPPDEAERRSCQLKREERILSRGWKRLSSLDDDLFTAA